MTKQLVLPFACQLVRHMTKVDDKMLGRSVMQVPSPRGNGGAAHPNSRTADIICISTVFPLLP